MKHLPLCPPATKLHIHREARGAPTLRLTPAALSQLHTCQEAGPSRVGMASQQHTERPEGEAGCCVMMVMSSKRQGVAAPSPPQGWPGHRQAGQGRVGTQRRPKERQLL